MDALKPNNHIYQIICLYIINVYVSSKSGIPHTHTYTWCLRASKIKVKSLLITRRRRKKYIENFMWTFRMSGAVTMTTTDYTTTPISKKMKTHEKHATPKYKWENKNKQAKQKLPSVAVSSWVQANMQQ